MLSPVFIAAVLLCAIGLAILYYFLRSGFVSVHREESKRVRRETRKQMEENLKAFREYSREYHETHEGTLWKHNSLIV